MKTMNPFDGEMLKSGPAGTVKTIDARVEREDTRGSQHLDDWRQLEGVRTRRVMAFFIDYVIVALLCIPFAFIVFLLGIITLGLGWMLFAVFVPLVALTYVAFTMGGSKQATMGMQMMNIRLERLDGQPIDPVLAAVHSVLFWAGNVVLSPLLLVATLVLDRKRTIHDLLLGTMVVRSDV